jgi:hypothetical protein
MMSAAMNMPHGDRSRGSFNSGSAPVTGGVAAVDDAGGVASGVALCASAAVLCASGAATVGLVLGVEAGGVTGAAGLAGKADGACAGG